MSEKKEKKVTAKAADIESMAGLTALADAILAASEPEEIVDVPEEKPEGAAHQESGKNRE